MKHAFIIAEAGVNHNGDLEMARQLVAEAAAAGADAVKFQTFSSKLLVTAKARKAPYQEHAERSDQSQLEMLQKLELSRRDHEVLLDCCRENQIIFLSTAFDLNSIALLAGLGQTCWKIPSGEITNVPYLRRIGSLGHEIILSTGYADLAEVSFALSVMEEAGTPPEKIWLLHCTAAYPTPPEQINLRVMQTLRDTFPACRVGLSDHSEGLEIPFAAVALGATLLEKHFTLDRSLVGPDHKASIEPDELRAMVKGIRTVEKALGKPEKIPQPAELENILVGRKFLVAARGIQRGEVFSEENVTAKRTGCGGLGANHWDSVLGRKALRNYEEDEALEGDLLL